MKKIIVLFLAVCLGLGHVAAQTRVTGKVTSADDGQPVAFATVAVKGFSTTAMTENDGSYVINVPAGGEALIFSFVGMNTQEVPIGSRSVINVALESDATVLDDILVVAYGTVKKGGYTGAAVSLDAKTIETRPVTSVTSVLEGSTGIMTTSAAGQPGSSPSIRVRGFGSINASNNPLIVLDGFPFDGSIADINASDIENITVLKDAAASSLYGARAANGVVLVTTKKGRTGSLSVNFRTTHGFSTRAIAEYDRIGAYDFVPVMWESMRNGLLSGGSTVAAANTQATRDIMTGSGLANNPFNVPAGSVMQEDGTMNPNARLLYDDFDWTDAMFRTGYRGEYNLDASGGSEKVTYMFSLGYLNEKGYTIGSDIKRISGRAAIDARPTKWFKTGITLNSVVSETNNTNTDSSSGYNNPFYFARVIAPVYPIHKHNADGTFMLDDSGEKIYEWNNRAFGLGRHIVAETEWNTRKYERNTLGARAYGEFTFTEGLKLTLNAGYDQRNNYYTNTENPHVGDGAPAGRSYRNYYTPRTWNFNQLLTYDKSFGSHSINLLAGHESYEYNYNTFYGRRTGVILEGNTELINYTTVASLTSYADKEAVEGYLFRATYDYDSKYYLSASYRRDGSSRFHKDVRWGNFWSLGGSWRMDREDFLRSIDWISMLKLRVAYGETGNSGITDSDGYDLYYPWLNLYNIQRNANAAGFIMAVEAGNDKLEWEKNSTFSAAVEFSLFKNRLSGTIEFYHRISDNLLFNVPLPVSSGMELQPQNIGTMYNQGFEVDLTGDILRLKDFRWNMNLNLATVRNRITKMPPDQPTIIVGTKRHEVGHSMYDYWLRTYVGVNPANGSVMFLLDESTNYGTNYYEYEGKLVTENQNYAKYEYHDSSIPDLYGGIRNTFSYKNLSLAVLLTYSLGGKVYDNNYAVLMSSGEYGHTKHVDILNRWQNPGDITDVPRMDNSATTAFSAQSSRWLIDGSYLSLKSIVLSYTLPKTFAQRLDLSNISTYVSAENLFLLTHRKGMNPSQNFTGVQSNVYMPARIVTFGLNLSF